MVDRTNVRSEKCVFTLKSLSSRYRVLKRDCSFTSTLIDLKKFSKDATRRAVRESRAEVFSFKKNKSTHYFLSGWHVFPFVFTVFGITAQLKCNVYFTGQSVSKRGFNFVFTIHKCTPISSNLGALRGPR